MYVQYLYKQSTGMRDIRVLKTGVFSTSFLYEVSHCYENFVESV